MLQSIDAQFHRVQDFVFIGIRVIALLCLLNWFSQLACVCLINCSGAEALVSAHAKGIRRQNVISGTQISEPNVLYQSDSTTSFQ